MRSKGVLATALATAALTLTLVPAADAALEGIHKIQHVVMIMQENRSFDSYFGTYPGANGIPGGICVPNPLKGGCVAPFHDPNDENAGGPHGVDAAVGDINGGNMDGFVGQAEKAVKCASEDPTCSTCTNSSAEAKPSNGATPYVVKGSCIDAMGYHDAREIPNYWAYAQGFALQDNLYEAAASWSLPEHLFLVSGWSALCPRGDTNPFDCVNSLEPATPGKTWSGPIVPGKATYAWTDLTYLMAKANVSWRYYVSEGGEPDCESDEAVVCKPVQQGPKTPGIWNPLAAFTDVQQDGQLENIRSINDFYTGVHDQSSCGLPKVSWVLPNSKVSEHPPSLVSKGQTYVTTLVNSIMRSPCWADTAIFVSWDDWGGFYDHVMPPGIDQNGYGLRVPGLVISPYAKTGYIDHQQLSHDAYLKFIEDDFLNGARLDPQTDGRPDRRPDVREEAAGLGDIANDFNFEQLPRPPLLLSPHPAPGPASEPPGGKPEAPTVLGGPTSSLAQTSATLNATVNPNRSALTDCRFEYGSSVLYETSVPCSPASVEGNAPAAVSAQLQGLNADTTYHFRILATNVNGTATGTDQTLTTLPNPPVVSSVTPNAGLQEGGTSVTIQGANLARASAIRFGSANATGVTVRSDTSITAVSPSGSGVADVTAITPGGSSPTSSADRFTYVPAGAPPHISSVSPKGGPAAGATSVTINGTGFVGVTAVRFGSTGAASFATGSASSLTGVSPAATAQTTDITVTTPNGTSSLSLKDRFQFGPPTVTSVSPEAGSASGGTSIKVTGSGFALGVGLTTLKFGSTAGTPVECPRISECTVVSPAHQAGSVDVTATVDGQSSRKAAPADRFTFK